MSDEPDSAAMRRFYQCDEAAFSLVAELWWPRLFGFFRRSGFSAEDAEDLTQTALVKLYLTKDRLPGHGRYDVGQPLAPFLFRLAINLAAQVRRTTGARVRWVDLGQAEAATELRGAHHEANEELAADLAQCIGVLSETQRLYINLCAKHGLGDLSHNQIGEVLNKWPAQVTQLSKSALSNLRDCMEGKGYR